MKGLTKLYDNLDNLPNSGEKQSDFMVPKGRVVGEERTNNANNSAQMEMAKAETMCVNQGES